MILEFIDAGHNVFMASDHFGGDTIELASECGVKVSDSMDFRKMNDSFIISLTSKAALFLIILMNSHALFPRFTAFLSWL